jgi:hypothetical protein
MILLKLLFVGISVFRDEAARLRLASVCLARGLESLLLGKANWQWRRAQKNLRLFRNHPRCGLVWWVHALTAASDVGFDSLPSAPLLI